MESRFFNRNVIRRAKICSITLMLLIGIGTDVYAEWQAETKLYLSGISTYVHKDHSAATHNFVATSAELEFSSRDRPYSASLFADYRFSTNSHLTDIVYLGGYIRYKLRNWDATTYLFVNQTPGIEDAWYYAARLRYRLAEHHKLGILASGSFRYPESPALAFGYFGSITDSLSLNVIADPGFNKGPDLAAQMELVWQVR